MFVVVSGFLPSHLLFLLLHLRLICLWALCRWHIAVVWAVGHEQFCGHWVPSEVGDLGLWLGGHEPFSPSHPGLEVLRLGMGAHGWVVRFCQPSVQSPSWSWLPIVEAPGCLGYPTSTGQRSCLAQKSSEGKKIQKCVQLNPTHLLFML